MSDSIGGLKVCMIAAEAHPFAKAGGLADVVTSLSAALHGQGVELRILTPLYSQARQFTLKKIGDLHAVVMGNREYPGAVYLDAQGEHPMNYFVENDSFFGRAGIYTDPESGQGYPDHFERYNFFSLACLQALERMQWRPDLIHCHDSHPALIPAYLKEDGKVEFLRGVPTVLTIHNLAYQGIFPAEKFRLTGLPDRLFHASGPFEFFGNLNMMKAGIHYSDLITTVSETYAREIQTPEYGCGLEGVLQERKEDLHGIRNGIDEVEWNPQTDPLIFSNFSLEHLAGKEENTRRLRKLCGLSQRSVPVIGMITRLVDQKGLDILFELREELPALDCQWVVLGTGLAKYQTALKELANQFPDHFSVHLEFNNTLAHRIEAGSDLFLMPSRYEPCGLNQMYSMRYGTIPVVRRTGGLSDTVVDFDPDSGRGNGISFEKYSSRALLRALKRALALWANPGHRQRLMSNAMKEDFSWNRSASAYLSLYHLASGRASSSGK